MKKIICIICLVVIAVNIFSQQLLTGYVYHDANKNGQKDRNEKGVPNVRVSNSLDVVLTDKTGKYELNVVDDDIIFVVKPSDYTVATDKNNLPQFYYIHKPMGSPANAKFEGVKPTGELPKSVDFGLIPTNMSNEFTALVFGDPQVRDAGEMDIFKRTVIEELKDNKKASFGISLGDLMFDDLSLNESYKEAIKEVGLPWYNVMGNHDMNFDAETDEHSDETFEANYGPSNYSFDYGDAHFIILDNILYPDPRNETKYWGGFREDQFQWLKNNLKHVDKDKLLVISLHIPLLNEKAENFSVEHRNRFFDLLKDYQQILVMSAHTHLQRQNFYGDADNWFGSKLLHEFNVGTSCGDWYKGELNSEGIPLSMMYDGTPKGYVYLEIKGNQYSFRYKTVGMPDDYQMRIHHPKVVASNRANGSQIVVNFFVGSPDDKVEFSVNDGKWIAMRNEINYDPHYLNLYYKWDFSDTLLVGRRPSKPQLCNHLWTANIPFRLPAGDHSIQVRATDMFGNVYVQKSKYQIVSIEE